MGTDNAVKMLNNNPRMARLILPLLATRDRRRPEQEGRRLPQPMHDTVLELWVPVSPNKDISAAQSLAGLALPFQRKDTGTNLRRSH